MSTTSGQTTASPARSRWVAGPSQSRASDVKGSVRRLVAMLRPERAIMAVMALTGAGSVAALVWAPRMLGQATNIIFAGFIGKHLPPHTSKQQVVENLRASGKGNQAGLVNSLPLAPGHGVDFDHLGRVLVAVALVYVAAWVLGTIQGRLSATIVQRCICRLRQQAEDKLARLPLGYLDGQPRGEVLSRVTNDIDNLAQVMQQCLSQIVLSVVMFIGALAFMFLISWLLALIAVVTVPVSLLLTKQIAKKSKPQFVRQWSTTGTLNGHVDEMYTGHSLVKVFGRQKESAQAFDEQNEALYQASSKGQFIAGLIMPVLTFIGNINYVLVAVVGGLKVASGSLSLGDVQAFIQYARQFSQPANQLATMASMLQSGIASAERAFELLDAPEQEPDKDGAIVPSEIGGRVTFEHVSFSYFPDKPLITDLSLRADPGQTVAIVGPTGAGKTTLVNLLMRFYEVNGGRITVDGMDIRDMTREGLRAKTGMVLQDVWLFGGTIAENIAYGAKNPAREQIVAAARATHVDHFVRTLPDGYDTALDDEGGNLSAGELQLVAIARAFLAEPAILILDEATSSVDTRTEVLIQRAMRKLRQGRTSFIIAHRLSTIRDADLILVMEHGDIVEQGTHDELVGAEGPYQRLYSAQFAQAVAEVA